SGFDSVLIDNFQGAYTAVSHLVENGHQKIGLIGSQPDAYPSIQEREQGYRAALFANGIQEAFIESSPLLRDEAFDATLRLMNDHPEITAIFASNDTMALGVYGALREMNLSIPDDV